jgi:hypothetical protein
VPSSARLPLIAGAALPIGFGVAELTGVRAIGGAVLLAGLGLALVVAARDRVPPGHQALIGLVAFAAFVVSHPLGTVLPPMVAATLAGVLVAAVAAAV